MADTLGASSEGDSRLPPPQLSLAVVGAQHPNKKGPTRLFEIAMCVPGEPVELRPEPNNKHDPRAVAIYSCRGYQIGYVAAERAALIGQRLRQCEAKAIFHAKTEKGALIVVSFDGNDPDLPPDWPGDGPEPDFWPDEQWPD
jgi:hypothetical protein